jgi:kinetochore protein NDC80
MNLLDFLIKSGYDKPISQKILTAPSSKDFQMIFKFLFAKIDPTADFDKKFEDEVPVLLKGIRYPFANEISKSQLYAVGSMHAWPSLLAMLSWIVDLIQVSDAIEMQEVNNPIDDPEGIFFEYLCKSYKIFLAGSDDYDGLIKEMSASFGNNFRIHLLYRHQE